MADWKKGDLALCVNNTPCDFESEAHRLVIGRIYKVGAVGVPAGGSRLCLAFRDIRHPANPKSGCAFAASRFIKVTPQSEDAFDREVIAHMAGQEVEA